MSTAMPATAGHSEACCNIPPVVSKGYKPKGTYEELAGYKTYVTGPTDATRGIVVVMDIFGFFDQTIQGSDILATSDDRHKYRVFMPDWFKGEPAPIGIFPPDTPEKQKQLGDFLKNKNPPAGVAKQLPGVVKALAAVNPSIESWGVIGFCWGGKVVSLTTAEARTNPFAAGAECHPAMVEPDDAAAIRVPLCMLASRDEPADKVREFEGALTMPKHVEIFADQVHGWMAARADLSDERVREEYARGYKTVLEFFAKHWA